MDNSDADDCNDVMYMPSSKKKPNSSMVSSAASSETCKLSTSRSIVRNQSSQNNNYQGRSSSAGRDKTAISPSEYFKNTKLPTNKIKSPQETAQTVATPRSQGSRRTSRLIVNKQQSAVSGHESDLEDINSDTDSNDTSEPFSDEGDESLSESNDVEDELADPVLANTQEWFMPNGSHQIFNFIEFSGPQ